MKYLSNFLKHLKGSEQKSAGEKAGKDKAKSEKYEEMKMEAYQQVTGEYILAELDELRDEISCPSCKRTDREYCKKCQRTRKGLDHLAGRVAKKYTDKESRWKEGFDE